MRPDDAARRQVRPVRQTEAEVPPAAKPHRPAPTKPPVAQADDHPAPVTDEAERDALFQEFLRWRDHH